MKWNDVTLSQFIELQDLIKIEDETDRVLAIMDLFFGDAVSELPLAEYNKKVKELKFLQDEVPTNHIVNKVEVNGHKYTIDALVGHISTAQYVDFTNYLKGGDDNRNIPKILAVFFIPEGHKYNDGYDMEGVIRDMGSLPIDIAMSESFFFSRQYAKFIQIFRSSSIKQIKKTDLPKEVKKNLIKAVDNSVDLVLSPLSSNFAK